MTGKRFNSILYEDFCRVITDNGKEINPLQVVDLLNELHEENESLKEENKFLRNKVATYKKGNALLKKTLDKEWK